MLRKATIGLTTLAIATTTAIAPAMADNTITSETVPADAIATTETAPEQEANSSKLSKDDIHNKLEELSSKHQENKQDREAKHEAHKKEFDAKLDALSSKTEDFNAKVDKFIKNIDFDKIQDALKVVEKIIIIAGKLA
ncbi:hypothetical protein [Corynebacterium yonathiae]|uniref:Secreted protein n=1 Tax=Corynebacterium yonathiae TaxID=2913504 RepID=A0A9X3LYP6_9CORY|nr:hypothetical protein [Corynebacterium yonathiae]MCZ9296546.1 hypothetical protein [Corynebacterium yonathiae]